MPVWDSGYIILCSTQLVLPGSELGCSERIDDYWVLKQDSCYASFNGLNQNHLEMQAHMGCFCTCHFFFPPQSNMAFPVLKYLKD